MIWKTIERKVKEAAKEAVNRYCASDQFKAKLDEIILANPVFKFRKAMQQRYMAFAPKLTAREAWDHAGQTLVEFLKGEEIEFGDPRYAWDEGGAHALVDDDLTYWEAA